MEENAGASNRLLSVADKNEQKMQVQTMSPEALDALVHKRIDEGWVVESGVLLPPEGDKRRMWAALWVPYGDFKIPHWISRED